SLGRYCVSFSRRKSITLLPSKRALLYLKGQERHKCHGLIPVRRLSSSHGLPTRARYAILKAGDRVLLLALRGRRGRSHIGTNSCALAGGWMRRREGAGKMTSHINHDKTATPDSQPKVRRSAKRNQPLGELTPELVRDTQAELQVRKLEVEVEK